MITVWAKSRVQNGGRPRVEGFACKTPSRMWIQELVERLLEARVADAPDFLRITWSSPESLGSVVQTDGWPGCRPLEGKALQARQNDRYPQEENRFGVAAARQVCLQNQQSSIARKTRCSL